MDNAGADFGRMQAELLQTQKLSAIGQLAAGIAHEINTPTQYVSDNLSFLARAFRPLVDAVLAGRGLIEQAAAGTVPAAALEAARKAMCSNRLDFMIEQVPEALSQSAAGLDRIAKLVVAMKEFSHPSSGVKEPLSLSEIIDTTMTVARHEWRYVADLTTNFDPELPPVPVLRDELGQVILNLAVNAAHAIGDVVKAAPGTKGQLAVSTFHRPPYAEIHIRDSGTGIPESARARLFEPFFTTKEVGKGTGQGLAIAYSVVVEKHGGQITFETEMGAGTTFIVRLPLDPPEAAS